MLVEQILELIRQKGNGFYCIITTNNEITDIFKVIVGEQGVSTIQGIGDKTVYFADGIANMIEQEGAGDGFIFLNDVVHIPEPSDADLIGRDEMDFTIGEHNHINKDKEISEDFYPDRNF
jgi:hypothetical protein